VDIGTGVGLKDKLGFDDVICDPIVPREMTSPYYVRFGMEST